MKPDIGVDFGLGTKETDGSIEFCVGNSDSYIPPEDLGKIFEAFYTKGKEQGTGLGLAIAKMVVEAHGGSIRCQSSKTHGTGLFFPSHQYES